ncbi:MAG: hypothetical protein J0I32_17880 [Sphingobacteriales bacterium]|nr:hypothetical protein [Sphingobacteriales bacterium]OJV97446.1 MAG: hypothetical protein BGO52_09160 [Sphingobacteriales bacterium 44-61]
MISGHRFLFFLIVFFLAGAAIASLVSCNAAVQQEEKFKASADMLYMDYQVTGEEERGEITVRLVFRYGGPEGRGMLLDTSASVSFDGQQLAADSSKMGGVYYEARYLAQGFEGLHQIEYKDGVGKVYVDTFSFPFFSLRSAGLPATVSRTKGLELEIDGLKEKDELHVMLTDTSFYGRGIDRLDTLKEGKMVFTQQDLDKLKNGPVHLEFYREKELGLNQTSRQGGRLYLSYNLSREFVLIE